MQTLEQFVSSNDMRKEIFLAIVVGIIVGLGITFGLFILRQRFLPNQTAREIEDSRQQVAAPTPTSLTSQLVIQQPNNNLLTKDSTVQVVGKSWPNSYITILAADEEYITVTDDDGDFSQEVELELGGNRLTVIATSQQGEQEELVLSLVYSTVDLSNQNSSDEANQSTGADNEQ